MPSAWFGGMGPGLLIQALGGGWNVADLPSTQAVTEREQPADSTP